jgi:hypothetical protein
MRTTWLRNAGVALLLGALGACSESGPGETETVSVQMRQTDDIIAQVAGGWYASLAGSADASGSIDADAVASLTVEVTAIQFLPAGEEGNEDNDGAWVNLDLGSAVELDLMALPTEGESPLVIASGEVPVGDYVNLRLFVDNAVIRFSAPINLGAAIGFDADVDYDVTVPSGAQTGIKTDASFSVAADTDVNLLFSPGSTFLNVTGTGTGEVILAPVIRGTSEQGS